MAGRPRIYLLPVIPAHKAHEACPVQVTPSVVRTCPSSTWLTVSYVITDHHIYGNLRRQSAVLVYERVSFICTNLLLPYSLHACRESTPSKVVTGSTSSSTIQLISCATSSKLPSVLLFIYRRATISRLVFGERVYAFTRTLTRRLFDAYLYLVNGTLHLRYSTIIPPLYLAISILDFPLHSDPSWGHTYRYIQTFIQSTVQSEWATEAPRTINGMHVISAVRLCLVECWVYTSM